jgi:hypothetical protein
MGWTPNRVAQVEALRRPVSLIEAAGLCAVFKVPFAELLAGDGLVELPGASSDMPVPFVTLASVRDALAEGAPLVGAMGQQPLQPLDDEGVEALYGEHGVIFTATPDEDRKAAARLGVDAYTVRAAAERLWGRSLAQERDVRIGDLAGLPKRSAQAKRGNVTRGLLAELRAFLDHERQLRALHGEERR